MTRRINIQWEGPFPLNNLDKVDDKRRDYGLYQVYGSHPVYGSDVLVYIGRTADQTFSSRLKKEYWKWNPAGIENMQVHVGRLIGNETPSDLEWSNEIIDAEQLLIVAHWPACNSSGINITIKEELCNTTVLNWGSYRDLLPEVSGLRYSRYSEWDNFKIYEKKN
jgi:hypothetical protein